MKYKSYTTSKTDGQTERQGAAGIPLTNIILQVYEYLLHLLLCVKSRLLYNLHFVNSYKILTVLPHFQPLAAIEACHSAQSRQWIAIWRHWSQYIYYNHLGATKFIQFPLNIPEIYVWSFCVFIVMAIFYVVYSSSRVWLLYCQWGNPESYWYNLLELSHKEAQNIHKMLWMYFWQRPGWQQIYHFSTEYRISPYQECGCTLQEIYMVWQALNNRSPS